MLSKVWVSGKGILARGIVKDHGLSRAQNILDNGSWQRSIGHKYVGKLHEYAIPAGGGFGLYPLLKPVWENQQPALSPGMLNRRSHQCIDQFFQNDLTRYCL